MTPVFSSISLALFHKTVEKHFSSHRRMNKEKGERRKES
jgi:hypothetical protein